MTAYRVAQAWDHLGYLAQQACYLASKAKEARLGSEARCQSRRAQRLMHARGRLAGKLMAIEV